MCGPSAAQTETLKSEQAFFNTLQSNYQTEFGQNEAVFNELKTSLDPIVAAGINQQGYSPQEIAALNTQAIQSAGTQVSQEEKAASESEAARSSGVPIPSGAQEQLSEEIGAGAETNLSNEELGITEQSATTGRQNYLTAVGALSGLPNVATSGLPSFAGATTGAGTATGSEANTIANQGMSWLGALGGLAGAGADVASSAIDRRSNQ